ncbi:hypothetical protein EGW08_010536 [Elysia chlorotica]|uniref:Uncharacterized protein n=1 Tax=Elysia chlorotica TaxID=188477 RepID=A0A433TJD2_ELYCH|nr:hypothetical protein EGW08_010536 [Elysia chlorotica]
MWRCFRRRSGVSGTRSPIWNDSRIIDFIHAINELDQIAHCIPWLRRRRMFPSGKRWRLLVIQNSRRSFQSRLFAVERVNWTSIRHFFAPWSVIARGNAVYIKPAFYDWRDIRGAPTFSLISSKFYNIGIEL